MTENEKLRIQKALDKITEMEKMIEELHETLTPPFYGLVYPSSCV